MRKSILIGLKSVQLATSVSIWYNFFNFLLPLIPAICRIGNSPNFLFPRCREQHESHPILHSIASSPNYTRLHTRGLINLNYTFNVTFS